jgi:cobalt/nickel transport system permease protein
MLDPRAKIISFLAFVILVVLTPAAGYLNFYLYFVLILLLTSVSKVPLGFIFRRSLVVIPFVLLATLFPLFSLDGTIIFIEVMAKAWLSVLSLSLLVSTTRFTDLLSGFQYLGMPRTMIMILSFFYRYVFILTDELMRLRRARDSRNFGGSWSWRVKTIGNMLGTLFIRAYERGERVYSAMASRGFTGEIRTVSRLRAAPADYSFAILFFASILLIRLI